VSETGCVDPKHVSWNRYVVPISELTRDRTLGREAADLLLHNPRVVVAEREGAQQQGN
jgi:hypothetical protein